MQNCGNSENGKHAIQLNSKYKTKNMSIIEDTTGNHVIIEGLKEVFSVTYSDFSICLSCSRNSFTNQTLYN